MVSLDNFDCHAILYCENLKVQQKDKISIIPAFNMRQKAVKIDGLSFRLLRVHINLSHPVENVPFQRPNRGIDINDFSNERPNRIRNNQQNVKSPSYKEENKNRHQPLNHHISDYYHNRGTVNKFRHA